MMTSDLEAIACLRAGLLAYAKDERHNTISNVYSGGGLKFESNYRYAEAPYSMADYGVK